VYRNIPQSIPSSCLTYLLVCLGFFHSTVYWSTESSVREQGMRSGTEKNLWILNCFVIPAANSFGPHCLVLRSVNILAQRTFQLFQLSGFWLVPAFQLFQLFRSFRLLVSSSFPVVPVFPVFSAFGKFQLSGCSCLPAVLAVLCSFQSLQTTEFRKGEAHRPFPLHHLTLYQFWSSERKRKWVF